MINAGHWAWRITIESLIAGITKFFILYHGATALVASLFRIRDHTRHTTLGRIPLGKWSVRRRDLYIKTHNNHKTQTSNTPEVFKPRIPSRDRSPNHALYHAATGRIFNDYLTKSQRKPTAVGGMNIVRQRAQKRTCAKNSKRRLSSKDTKVKVPRTVAWKTLTKPLAPPISNL